MGKFLRSGGLLYFVILIVLAVVLVNMLSRGNPDVAELNSQQWSQAVQNETFDTSLDKIVGLLALGLDLGIRNLDIAIRDLARALRTVDSEGAGRVLSRLAIKLVGNAGLNV